MALPALKVDGARTLLEAWPAAIEGAVWAARDMARAAPGLAFLPLGRHGRAVWADGGPPERRLSRYLAAVAQGAEDAARMLDRLSEAGRL